ncbi:MAG: outer membrane protein transport protein [Verrucomicrobiota bacterium JB023]|nr:outer membrane protein transport protein [Verrucomicrobiota bacterium JB023]
MKMSPIRILGLSLLLPHAVEANGFFVTSQSTEATARGGAFVATADNASAVYYNPAGLTQLSAPQAQVGVYSIQLGNTYTNGSTTLDADQDLQAIPHLYYATPVTDRLAVGMGLNVPFGLATDWGSGANNPFRQVATTSKFSYLTASAVAAYEVTDQLSIGMGATVSFANAELSQYSPLTMSESTLEGDGVNAGAIFGLRYQPHEQHSFGAVLRTGGRFELDGSISVLGSASLAFDIPTTAAIGYAYRPTDKLIIEANVEWADWDSLNTYDLKANTPFPLPSLAFDWRSAFIYEIGFTYQLTDSFAVHAGYDYNEGAMTDTYYNPGIADADRHWLNLGFTHTLDDFEWSVGYQFGFSDHTVTESVIGTNGDYEARHHAFFLSLQKTF